MDNVLLQLRQRGELFLDEKLRLSNFFSILQESAFRTEFNNFVINNSTDNIETLVSEIIDWLVDKNTNQWKRVLESFQFGFTQHYHQQASTTSNWQINYSDFQTTRKQLLQTIGQNISQLVKTYDKYEESKNIASKVHSSILQAAAITGVGALGIGTLISISLFDITGILGASAIAVTGLCIIPYRRSVVKKEFSNRIELLRTNINDSLKDQFENELNSTCSKLRLSISPFTTYVKKEEATLSELSNELSKIISDLENLQKKI